MSTLFCHSIGISASYAETLSLEYSRMEFLRSYAFFFSIRALDIFCLRKQISTFGIFALIRKILSETWIFLRTYADIP